MATAAAEVTDQPQARDESLMWTLVSCSCENPLMWLLAAFIYTVAVDTIDKSRVAFIMLHILCSLFLQSTRRLFDRPLSQKEQETEPDWDVIEKDGPIGTISDGISRTGLTGYWEELSTIQLNIEQAKCVHKQLANDILKARSELKSVRRVTRQAKHELDMALFSIEDIRKQLSRAGLPALQRNDEGENDCVPVDPEEVPR